MNPSEYVLVIPSIREINLDYLKYVPEEVALLVVDDSNGSIKPNRPHMQVFDYAFQERVMGRDYDLIPHKTAACRNFAFYYIWKHTDYRYVLTLDDDCKTGPGFMEAYSRLGQVQELETVCTPNWYNTIDNLGPLPEKIYARGYPYWERHSKEIRHVTTKGREVCKMGLWDNVLDIDALDKYLFPSHQKSYADLALARQTLRVGTPDQPVKFPFSAMNFGFIREALPIMYQMPMVESYADRYAIWRFDDIWAGYILESLIARRGDAITIGSPLIHHMKAGNLSKELLGEHYGHLISPYLYAIIDEAVESVSPAGYAAMYVMLFEYILQHETELQKRYQVPALYWNYIIETVRKLARWGRLFLS